MRMIYRVALLTLGGCLPALAHALPAGFSDTVAVRGLTSPTAMTFLPDGRLLVAEQAGTLRLVDHGKLVPTPYLTVRTKADGERGLLGVTVDPQFKRNHYIYVYYTVAGSTAHNRVRRFTQNAVNPNIAQWGSGLTVLDLDPLSDATNHNGGAIHFGTDGKLYIGVGENANGNNAQDLTNRLGKILRLNPDGSIPRDNPLLTRTTGRNQAIWAYGLRNPFTFAVDPSTGVVFINDVGQNAHEEIDRGLAGANYGWPMCEGKCTATERATFTGISPTDPIYQYNHNLSSAAITGGAFYRQSLFPASYAGSYFFGDYLKDRILQRQPNGKISTFQSKANGVVDIQIGTNGKLYYLSITDGLVRRISY